MNSNLSPILIEFLVAKTARFGGLFSFWSKQKHCDQDENYGLPIHKNEYEFKYVA
jgi:hypothetical protein